MLSDKHHKNFLTTDHGNSKQEIFQLEKCEFRGKSQNSRNKAQTSSVSISVIKHESHRLQLWLPGLGLPPDAEACWRPPAAARATGGPHGACCTQAQNPLHLAAGDLQVTTPAGDFTISSPGTGEEEPAVYHSPPHHCFQSYCRDQFWGSH